MPMTMATVGRSSIASLPAAAVEGWSAGLALHLGSRRRRHDARGFCGGDRLAKRCARRLYGPGVARAPRAAMWSRSVAPSRPREILVAGPGGIRSSSSRRTRRPVDPGVPIFHSAPIRRDAEHGALAMEDPRLTLRGISGRRGPSRRWTTSPSSSMWRLPRSCATPSRMRPTRRSPSPWSPPALSPATSSTTPTPTPSPKPSPLSSAFASTVAASRTSADPRARFLPLRGRASERHQPLPAAQSPRHHRRFTRRSASLASVPRAPGEQARVPPRRLHAHHAYVP